MVNPELSYQQILQEAIHILEEEGYEDIKAMECERYDEPDKIRKSLLAKSYQPDITARQNDVTFVFSIITEPFPIPAGLETFDAYTRKNNGCLVFLTSPEIRNVVESRLVSKGIKATVV